MSHDESCRACNAPLMEGATYCSTCGQRVMRHRFTITDTFTDIWSSIWSVEKGLVYTCKQIILSPRQFLTNYLNGITKPYVNVFRLILILTAFSFLINKLMGTFSSEPILTIQMDGRANGDDIENFIISNSMYMYILMVPFMSVGSWLIFRRHKLNYAEHLVKQAAWLSGSILVATPVVILLGILKPEDVRHEMIFYGACFILYYIYANRQLFHLKWRSSIVLSLLEMFVGYVLFSLFIMVVGVTIMFILNS